MKTKKFLPIALLVLALASCSSKDDKKTTEVKEELPIVEVVTIGEEAVKQTSEYTGTVEAFKTNNISSNSGARIKRILVDVGSRVARGQRLVILDDVNIAQQQIALANLKRELDRARELVKIGGGTQQTVDQLQAQYDATARAIRTMQENTVLTSPVSGVVTAKNYDAGDLPAGLPVLTIEQQNPLKVIVNVNESEYPHVKRGMPVTVKFDTYGDEVFQGQVYLIHPTVDATSRTFQVEVAITNRQDKVRTGMFARVNFNYGTTHSVVVPDRAVQKQVGSGVRYVWVYQGGEVELREVELGQRLEDRYEVKGGVVAGTQVVIAGASRLQDGAKVQLKK
ncbi:MAG: efflux RND transporter periplasmic adaptor subunit [Muribaculaceae bacterium]|nr:efflux RND transporter periplasmic adaptor subunit [Muribaculaceae bacterium]